MATFVVEDGTGKSDANSYSTTAEADAYHSNYGNPSSWSTLSDPDKQKALRSATQAIDALYGGSWRGLKANENQALDWPRINVFTTDYFIIRSNTIPPALKNATAVLALASLTEVLVPDVAKPGLVKRKRTKSGPVEQEIEYVSGLRATKVYSLASALLEPFLISSGLIERG